MDELRELYQQVILDHNKNPRNFRKLENADLASDGFNPLCGDQIHLMLRVGEDGIIEDIGFQGSGCAISRASASIMSSMVKGKRLDEVDELFERFHELVTGPPDEPVDTSDLGKLAVFGGVREFPVRVKCASLPWHTLRAALKNEDDAVSTE